MIVFDPYFVMYDPLVKLMSGKVVLIDQAAQRKGTGDKVTYLVGKKMIYVTGAPATVTGPNGNVSSQQISVDIARNKVEAMSSTSATQGTYKQTQ